MNSAEILERMAEVKSENPKIYARDLASKIGVSEGELLAAQIGENVIRLRPDMIELIQSLKELGPLMALTRNEHCVIECKGVYPVGKFYDHYGMKVGLLLNQKGIDLRLFMAHWAHVFAVEDIVKGNLSLQFFGPDGEAVHKVYVIDGTNRENYHALVARFTSEDQAAGMEVKAKRPAPKTKQDDEVDWPVFRAAWEQLEDVHSFYPMLQKFQVGRQQAFSHVGEEFAYELDNVASRRVLELAKEKECELMSFVGNDGCVEINTSIPDKLMEHGTWFNVLDSQFNLHLNEAAIAQTWVTKKPTKDGIVTSVEVMDGEGRTLITFYGQRMEGNPELEIWREIVELLPRKTLSNAAE
ncbi:hemin-degrading factor [Terasakiella pusilla]|uniref:hemin-degrading factor n=1 Tax=Terasakiella pusilla TaxID=64973 RepID=UPI003AA8E111